MTELLSQYTGRNKPCENCYCYENRRGGRFCPPWADRVVCPYPKTTFLFIVVWVICVNSECQRGILIGRNTSPTLRSDDEKVRKCNFVQSVILGRINAYRLSAVFRFNIGGNIIREPIISLVIEATI